MKWTSESFSARSGDVCLNEHPQNASLCCYSQKSTGNLPSLLLKVRFMWGKLIRSNCDGSMPFPKSTLRPECHWYTKCCVVYASVKYAIIQLDLNWRYLWVCNDGKDYNSWARFFIKFSCQCLRQNTPANFAASFSLYISFWSHTTILTDTQTTVYHRNFMLSLFSTICFGLQGYHQVLLFENTLGKILMYNI